MSLQMNSRLDTHLTKADWIVVALAIAMLLGLYVKFWGPHSVFVETVQLNIPGQAIQNLSLRENKILAVEGPLGITTIEVRDGKVRFVDSPCPGKQCVHAGWLSADGDFAACIPNHISLLVAGSDFTVDTVNF